MRTCTSLFLLPLCGSLVACDGGGEAGSGDTGIETASSASSTTTTTGPDDADSTGRSTTTGGGSPDDTTGTAPEDDGPEPPVTFDIGITPDFGELDDGCNAVDFLFVIDNSGSMDSAQDNLVANFPAFIDGIQNTLTDVESYHVGVATTDDYSSVFGTPSNPPECRQLGALITSTAGTNSSNAVCGPYTEGYNFITEEDDLAASFACAAQVGTGGSAIELTMESMQAAIGEDLNAEGACNEGFIRDEALLVVVLITDEADGPGDTEATSAGTPESWYASVLAAKDDIPENAAALVLTNYDDGPCVPQFDYADGRNLVEFAELFGENGFVAGICEPDYGPSFTSATAVIEQACENFIPPG